MKLRILLLNIGSSQQRYQCWEWRIMCGRLHTSFPVFLFGWLRDSHFYPIWHSCGPLVMTSSNGKIFRVTGFLWGEFTGHRWIPFTKARATQSFDVFFDLRLNKWLSKQSRRRWFETPSRSLWRHCNVKLLALSGNLKWENCNIIFAPRDLCIGLTFSPSNLYGVLYCRSCRAEYRGIATCIDGYHVKATRKKSWHVIEMLE